jgi:hypothetical protein
MDYRKWQAKDIFSGTSWLGPDSVLITTKNGTVIEIINQKMPERK